MALNKAAKTPPKPIKYHNDPTLVERLVTMTTKHAELERLSLLKTANPPPHLLYLDFWP